MTKKVFGSLLLDKLEFYGITINYREESCPSNVVD